ncbi:MAG: hypothetical protein HY820_12950 [Acidobacteria bacterium]|nr:hypothetical protein [Acidobacteriota bacterium]
MPQLGVLFDAQKLGSGFYGYTAFRILFTVAPPRDLAGCALYHGEVGDGRHRPYCIAVESDQPAVLNRLRQAFANSMARGLMPHGERFLEGIALQEEVLALAARVTQAAQIADCSSRWLQEAWQRATSQAALVTPTSSEALPVAAKPEPRPKAENKIIIRLPNRIPLALRTSPGGRRAVAWLLGFSMAGAALPWLGFGLASCALLFTVGFVLSTAIRWRIWSESDLAGEDVMEEALKLLGAKPLTEVSEKLSTSALQASPLLRRLGSTARLADANAGALLSSEHGRADTFGRGADISEVRLYSGGTFLAAAISLSAMWVSQGPGPAMLEAPRLLLAGLSGATLLWMLAGLLNVSALRLESQVTRLTALRWLPSLGRNVAPAVRAQNDGIEKGLHELAVEFQNLRTALEHQRESEVAETLSDLRSSLDQLTPVLAGFREPFVLQAVPMPAVPRPKAMSATA